MKSVLLSLLVAIGANVQAAGRLEISGAWIRSAPPGAPMLAGYATLHNAAAAALTITGVDSDEFARVAIHETSIENGIAKMRPVPRLEIAPGASVVLAPGARHLMLMRPTRSLVVGDVVALRLELADGQVVSADFQVRDAAPTNWQPN